MQGFKHESWWSGRWWQKRFCLLPLVEVRPDPSTDRAFFEAWWLLSSKENYGNYHLQLIRIQTRREENLLLKQPLENIKVRGVSTGEVQGKDEKHRPTQHFCCGLSLPNRPKKCLAWDLLAIINKYLLSLDKFINSSCTYPYAEYSQIFRSCWLIFNIYLYVRKV